MRAYQLVVSLQIATGLPAFGIVLAFLAEPDWTRAVFGPELLVGFAVIFFVLTFIAIGIACADEKDDNTPLITKERLRIVLLVNSASLIASSINGFLFRDWPWVISFIVSLLGLLLLTLSRRYR